jgi:two-component system, sensor histidine kinase and response regulator
LSNALKYSSPDRPVTLELRASPRVATVTVRDEGPGIGVDELPHVFERFYRAPGVDVKAGSQVGLGLGLFIAKAIIGQHGGRIWAESEVGKGSAFSFCLPLPEDPG